MSMTWTEADDAVRAAYHRALEETDKFIGASLADVRDRLPAGMSREDADAALRRLSRHPDVALWPDAGHHTMTEREEDAALFHGGETTHTLFIDPEPQTADPLAGSRAERPNNVFPLRAKQPLAATAGDQAAGAEHVDQAAPAVAEHADCDEL